MLNKKLNINSKTIIYAPLPPNIATGGPEAIYRLLHLLSSKFNIKTEVYFYPENHSDPVHKEYVKFNLPIAKKIIDTEENILILPDYYDHLILSCKYYKIQKCLWWLSIDNFYIGLYKEIYGLKAFRLLCKKIQFQNILNNLFPILFKHTDLAKECLCKFTLYDIRKLEVLKDIKIHLCQSYYAYNWLANFEYNNKYMLTDMFDDQILDLSVNLDEKLNLVAYNPAKGTNFTNKIIKLSKGQVDFVPITNCTKSEALALLKKCKLYIDFGNHPGRDRLPREAALAGCCIITSRRGSANFFEDVPIPERFKFSDSYVNIAEILRKIMFIINNYDQSISDFEDYRKYCQSINENSISEVKTIFNTQD